MASLKVWWVLLRPFAVLGTLPPLLLGFLLSECRDLSSFILSFAGTTAILFATHLHNSLSDYARGIDRGETAKAYTSASSILPLGLASVGEVRDGAITLYTAGSLIFVYLSLTRTPLCLIPLAIGLFCGISYNEFGKYRGLGELDLGLAFGMGCTLAGYIPSACDVSLAPVLVSFIPGALWDAFYCVDQLQDAQFDQRFGIRNLATVLCGYNFPVSRYIEFIFFIVLVSHLFFILIGLLPPSTFLSLTTASLMFLSILTCEARDYRRGAIYLILTFGLYVMILNLALLFSP